MKESQYIDQYLDAAERRRWTPETFLSYTLRGRAKDYSSHYVRSLYRAIQRRVEKGTVTPVRSIGGSIAYVRIGSAPTTTTTTQNPAGWSS